MIRIALLAAAVAATLPAALAGPVIAAEGQAVVRKEVEAAGFVLDAQSDLLAKKDDPHSAKVFEPSIKGATDRFAYRFVKR